MAGTDQRHPADIIRARAGEVPDTGEWRTRTQYIEVLASLAEGTSRLSELDERLFERIVDVHGLEAVIDAAATGAKLIGVHRSTAEPAEASETHTRRFGAGSETEPVDTVAPAPKVVSIATAWRWTWRNSAVVLGAAASVALVVRLVWHNGGPPNTSSELARVARAVPVPVVEWPAALAQGWSGQIVIPPHVLTASAPDFTSSVGTLGAGADAPTRDREVRARAARATVVVHAGSVWGNGVLLSPDGWALTSYRLVEAASQESALVGQTTRVEVVMLGDEVPGQPSQHTRTAALVYRADPVRDLVLLKLEVPATAPTPFAPLGNAVKVDDRCFLVVSNSQEAWHSNDGDVRRVFTYGGDGVPAFSQRDGNQEVFSRWRTKLVATDGLLLDGDIGAPLFDYARGSIMGLTVRPRVQRGSLIEAWHVPVDELLGFVADLPATPEGIPFDPWTAGRPELGTLEPVMQDADGDGRLDTLRYGYGVAGQRGATVVPRAVTMFVDLEQRLPVSTTGVRVPYGLWAVPGGDFRFDVFVTVREDGVAATGFVNAEGIVDEIRTGRAGSSTASVIWRRDQSGRWHAQSAAPAVPLVDSTRLGGARGESLSRLLGPLLRRPAPG